MTKKKFLKLLEQKLNILNEKEKQDIIDEYSNIIDEKVKTGITEKDAISSFGNVDELVKEILEAYKINPNYSKEAASETKRIMDNIENGISKVAKELGNGTKKLCTNFRKKNGEFNIDMLFEIILKVIILLIGLIILRIPFELISSLGKELFEIFMYPLNNILGITWQIIVGFVYFACVVLIVISVFKKYFYLEENKKDEQEKKDNKINEKKEDSVLEVKKEKSTNIILKILLTIIFLLPIWCINLSIIIAIGFVIYLLIKGIELWGILILLIGISFLFGFVADIINKLINRRRVYFFPLIVSSILITIGSLMFVESAMSYDFNDELKNSNLAKEITYEEKIYENTRIDTKSYLKNIIIDDNLDDGTILIKINHYNIYKIEKNSSNNKIEFDFTDKKNIKDVFDLVITDLKNKQIYNYQDIDDVIITIYVNNVTRDLIS